MPRRRFGPLADTRRPHWLTVSDLHRNLITCQAVPTGTDLHEVLRVALKQCDAEGWRSESDGAYGFTFIVRGTERRLVSVTPADPFHGAGTGYAFLAGQGVNH